VTYILVFISWNRCIFGGGGGAGLCLLLPAFLIFILFSVTGNFDLPTCMADAFSGCTGVLHSTCVCHSATILISAFSGGCTWEASRLCDGISGYSPGSLVFILLSYCVHSDSFPTCPW
jgi:hypothetical protein